MEPQNMRFGGGAAETAVGPVVILIVFVACLFILFMSRKRAIVAFLAAGILIPTDQVLVIGGAHFPMLRVLALFGLLRVFGRKLLKADHVLSGGVNAIDKAVLVLAVFASLDGVLLWREFGEVIFQIGNLITTAGVYLLLRHLIRQQEDVRRALRTLSVVTVVIASFMVYEYVTGRDLFYTILGGLHAADFGASLDRAGVFRARGCFAHPILAGSFAGFMFPMFIGCSAYEKEMKLWAILGAVSTIAIPLTTGSSTALFALLGAVLALAFWPIRRWMRTVRWGIVLVLCGLQSVMKSPVWHIISDVSLSQDSSSYHRYMLIDQCIRHFLTWALVGTRDYASWGWDMWDLSDQYVATANTAGLIPLIALLAILVYGFKYVGKMRRVAAKEGDKKLEFLFWAIGASLFGNVVAFFGISYFDQTIVAWYMVLAILSAMTMRVWGHQPGAAKAGAKAKEELAPAPMRFGTRPAFQSAEDVRMGTALHSMSSLKEEGS